MVVGRRRVVTWHHFLVVLADRMMTFYYDVRSLIPSWCVLLVDLLVCLFVCLYEVGKIDLIQTSCRPPPLCNG